MLTALLSPNAYAHDCDTIRIVETHISWVFLTGHFAYKLKKPVDLGFLDFSTLAKRRFYCEEELRCNRVFAPEIYLGVVGITRNQHGDYTVGDDGDVIEYAVKMRQFNGDNQLDRLLDQGELDGEMLHQFAGDLASIYEKSRRSDRAYGGADNVLAPLRDNFQTLLGAASAQFYVTPLARIRQWSVKTHQRLHVLLDERVRRGWIRERHGDLHLSNLVLTDDGIRAFDCIEFSKALGEIDAISDIAFLFMDCAIRQRADIAYRFLDGYLDATADYTGARLLRFYAVYRSLVRAKVAALQLTQSFDQHVAQKLERHINWAQTTIDSPVGCIYLMCGVSGSGKSYLAARLVGGLAALRLRSDLVRRTIANLDRTASSESSLDAGIYAPAMSEMVYRQLLDLTKELVLNGERVIIDATMLARANRNRFRELALQLSCQCIVILCEAAPEVLKQRVIQRRIRHDDPSEATLEVLDRQLAEFVRPNSDEYHVRIRTDKQVDLETIVTMLNDMTRGNAN